MKTFWQIVAIAICVFIVTAYLTAGRSLTASVELHELGEAVKADVHVMVQQFNAHDAAAVVGHDMPNVVAMYHGVPNAVGVAADLAITKQQTDDPAAKLEVGNEVVDVAMSREMAVYRCSYVYTYTAPKTKQTAVQHGNWLIGYRIQSDKSMRISWYIVSDTGS